MLTMFYLLVICIYPILLITTVASVCLNWQDSIRSQFRSDPKSVWLTIFGVLFTVISPALGFWRYDDFRPAIPFSPSHVAAVELMVTISAVSYWISRFAKREIPALVNWIVRAGLLQGILLCLVITVHFGPDYLLKGIAWPTLGFELDAPPFAALLLLYELVCNIRAVEPRESSSPISQWRFLLWGLLPVLFIVEQALLLPFGYSWNSFLLAFTHSRDFTFSHLF